MFTGSFKREVSDSCAIRKSTEMAQFVSSPIMSQLLLLMRMSISNNSSFDLKHTEDLDGFDGPHETSYPLIENHTPPVATVTGRISSLYPLL
jgi:hypothetical protein